MATKLILADRYANAILQYAVKAGITSEIGEILTAFGDAYQSDETLRILFNHPNSSNVIRMKTVESLLDSLNLNVSQNILDTIITFLEILVKKQRFIYLPEIVQRYDTLTNELRNQLPIKIKTAGELPEKSKQEIIYALKSVLNKTVLPEYVSDPTILAGFVAEGGGLLIDASLSGSLNRWGKHFESDINS